MTYCCPRPALAQAAKMQHVIKVHQLVNKSRAHQCQSAVCSASIYFEPILHIASPYKSQNTPRIQKPFRCGSAVDAQKHLRWTIVGPLSSYSVFEIHICWKVESDDRMLPPIQTEYLRSGGAITLIFIVDGARAVSSFVMRSPIPANIVVPPESTTFAYKSLRMSTSHFMMDWKVVS